jgi:hypothetical protein
MLGVARPGCQDQARWLRELGQELHECDVTAAITAHASGAEAQQHPYGTSA